MCEIRLIKSKDKTVVSDNVVKLPDVSFGLIDRPAYVINIDGKEGEGGSAFTGFHFEYLDSSEDIKTFKNDNVIIEFGEKSGRIYTYIGKNEQLTSSTLYSFSQFTRQFGDDRRYQANIKNSLNALNALLSL